jgi:hypothetical protein
MRTPRWQSAAPKRVNSPNTVCSLDFTVLNPRRRSDCSLATAKRTDPLEHRSALSRALSQSCEKPIHTVMKPVLGPALPENRSSHRERSWPAMPTFDKRHASNALQTRAPKHSHPLTDSSTEALSACYRDDRRSVLPCAHIVSARPLRPVSPRRSTHTLTEDTIAEPKGQHTRAPKRPHTLAYENRQDNSRSTPSRQSSPPAHLHRPVRHAEIDLPTRTPGV